MSPFLMALRFFPVPIMTIGNWLPKTVTLFSVAMLASVAPLTTASATAESSLESSHLASYVQVTEPFVVTLNTLHMGTIINIKTYAQSKEDAQRYAELADELASHYDDLLTVHRESPLNQVNEHAGEKVLVSPEIADLVRRSLNVAKETDGAFEPTIGSLVNVWKIGFGGQHVPDRKAIEQAVAKVDWHKVVVGQLPDGKDYVQIAPGQSLDLGGSAKGFIGTRMQEQLVAAGLKRGIISLGGNIVAIGMRPDKTPWRIGLQQPQLERNAYFGYVLAENESVITSGAYERYFEENGHRYGHILDPKTGNPVKTDVASVSIVDKDGTRADALCTAIFSMGWDRAIAFLKAHPDVRAVVLRSDMKTVAVAASLEKRFVLTDSTMLEETINP